MSNSTQVNREYGNAARRTTWSVSRTVKTIGLGCGVLLAACQSTDITTLEEQKVSWTLPTYQLDTSFVGDTVVSLLPYFVTKGCDNLQNRLVETDFGSANFFNVINQCQFAGNFDLTWSSTNPTVARNVGSAVQHVEVTRNYQFVKTAALTAGQARMTFTPSVPFAAEAKYYHDLVILPTPDRLDVPDVIVLAIGESTLLSATVRSGTGPGVNTGAVIWGPTSGVASMIAVDTVLRPQADGRLVTRSNMYLVIKGLAQGQVVLPVVFKKSVSFLDAGSVMSAPVMLQKNVTILVGASVHIVAINDGSPNDLSAALTPVAIGSQRSYRLLDQNDAVVPTQFWSSSNSNIAFVATTGVATCLAAGTVTLTATKPSTSLIGSTTLTCVGTFTLSVLTAPLSVTAGAQPPVLDTVQINRSNFPGPITLTAATDAGITIGVSPATTTGSSFELSVSAASTAALGVHSVLLTATGGLAPVTKTFAVDVKAPVVAPPSITLVVDPRLASVSQGRQTAISAVVTGGLNVTDVTWTTKDASVASLADNGGRSVKVNGLKAGSSTYIVANYAYFGGNARDSTLVTVTAASTAQVDHITLEPDSVNVANGQQVQYRVRYWNSSNAEMNGEVGNTTSFTVDASGIAQIGSSTGLLTTRGLGSTTVNASYRMPYYDSLTPVKASLTAKAKLVVR